MKFDQSEDDVDGQIAHVAWVDAAYKVMGLKAGECHSSYSKLTKV